MWRLASFLTLVALSGCSSISGSYPRSSPIVPDAALHLAPNANIPFTALAAAAVLYVVYDPLAPNWSITEKALDSDTYYLSLRAKSFRTGGDGEAMLIFKRRALQLQRERGFSGYRIVDYMDGIESSTPFTHRFSEGTIQLVRAETIAKP